MADNRAVENFQYALVLAFIGACACGVNLGFRLKIMRFWKIFLFTDAFILITFLTLDILAVQKEIWFFDPQQILGIDFFGLLPIEEVLFFILVPLMSILVYRALLKLTGWHSAEDKQHDLL